jgi:hypothetical protein
MDVYQIVKKAVIKYGKLVPAVIKTCPAPDWKVQKIGGFVPRWINEVKLLFSEYEH